VELQSSLRSLPSKSGVYIFKDKKGTILYIGKAKDLKNRVSSYFAKNQPNPKVLQMLPEIASIEHIVTPSEIDAFLLEANLIKQYKPFYNIKLSDDKFFPYLELSGGDNPAFLITRRTNNKTSEYFGPYADAGSLRAVYKLLRRIFPYQSVRNHPKGTCLYHHLRLCPCVLAHPQNKESYKKNLRNIKRFLKGDKDKLLSDLAKDREKYAKELEFEKAAALQDAINKIIQITSDSYDPFIQNRDPYAYQKKAENEIQALEEVLRNFYSSITHLRRIECYDISNIQGTNPTGSMVVLMEGIPDKAEYRRFRIRSKNTPDDFQMMKEMLTRRLKRDGWERADLLVIDGGKGQVSAVYEVLQQVGQTIPLIGLAKKEEIIVIPQNEDDCLTFKEVKLGKNNPAVLALRRIRD